MPLVLHNEKLVEICRHDLRLNEDYDVARLIREVKIVQEDSSDTYTRLTKEHRIKAREIMSGYMLAWEYVEDLDGSGYGQRFWKRRRSRPDALVWPEYKKKWILAGVEKMFNELQDYSAIDRQKRKSQPTPEIEKEANTDDDPPLPVAQSMIRSTTNQCERKNRQPKTNITPVPDHAVPIAQDAEFRGQASSQKNEPQKSAIKESNDPDPNTEPEGAATNKSTGESPPRERALTPPYIPELGLHQTWPAFGFRCVSKEGVRALRHRDVKIDDYEESPVKTPPTTPRRSKTSRVKTNRKHDSAGMYSSTASAERSEENHINSQDSKRTRSRLPSLPNSLLTRSQAAFAKEICTSSSTLEDSCANGKAPVSPTLSSEGPVVQTTTVQESAEPSANTAN